MQYESNYEIVNSDGDKIEKLSKSLETDPLISQILINRGISDYDSARLFLYGGIEDLHNPFLIGDMEKAVSLILEHINNHQKILIHGDYDADGVTSTAIMIKSLERIGGKAEYYIPNRFDEGYGFSPEAVDKALENDVRLIITVDCGSSNPAVVDQARNAGIDVIITDHHEVPAYQPSANAFINLKKPGEKYPFTELSGAGIAFKLIQALYSRLGRGDWTDFIDLVTIGTVADVVPLTGENRLIVKSGIELLNQRKHAGIAQLLEISNVTRNNLSPWDISFIIAPKINAAGRIDNADIALEFLLEDDPARAREQAQRLISLNEKRQEVENGIKTDIEHMMDENPGILSERVWVFSSRGWNQGVIGVVASRFAQSFQRPVFLISIDESGVGRGSSRCNENYSVYEALGQARDLLIHYGGHRLAGGFSIREENIGKLREKVSDPGLFKEVHHSIRIDAELEKEKINLDTAKMLEILSPFGEGNPKPLFMTRQIKIQSVAPVGKQDQHLKVWTSAGPFDVKGIAFGMGSKRILTQDFRYDILYNLDVDVWNNQAEPSMKIQDISRQDDDCMRIICDELAIDTDTAEGQWKLVDARSVINRRKYIKNLYKNSKPTLVLARSKKQIEVLIENLRQEGVECVNLLTQGAHEADMEKELWITTYDNKEFDINPTELILYHPPFLWDHFKRNYFFIKGLKRVHLLFDNLDVEREAANQEVLAPSREKLIKIYKYFQSILNDADFTMIKPRNAAKALKDSMVKSITIKVALKIFSEIELLEVGEIKETIPVKLKSAVRQDLESSATYKNQIQKKEIFTRLKELYLLPTLGEFRENLFQVVNS